MDVCAGLRGYRGMQWIWKVTEIVEPAATYEEDCVGERADRGS